MVCVYVCVCVSAFVTVISTIQKQITAEALNLVFYICIMHKHLYHELETLNEDRTKTLCTGAHKRILIH